MSMETLHKHHIVPIYKCIELGLTISYKINSKEFYFKENMVEVPREQHALIHWGYKCKDLKPLLEVCNPPQWVIDMIPLGDNRDVGAASVLALGEIEQIDVSGKNNPMWKGGISIGDNLEAYQKAYQQTPEYRAYDKKRQSTPEYKAYQKAHRQTPERKAYQKAYKQTPEYKAYQRAYYLRKKLEKQQGQGTLEQHIG
jgi:hypothetical protein